MRDGHIPQSAQQHLTAASSAITAQDNINSGTATKLLRCR